VRPAATLANAAGALEPHVPADLRPVDRVEPPELRLAAAVFRSPTGAPIAEPLFKAAEPAAAA
jgi:hypothetical protein